MDVTLMLGVDAGYTAMVLGGLLLLGVAMWWSWAGDGIEIPRERWPGVTRLLAAAGWTLFAAGIVAQLVGYIAHVGVARWPGAGH